MTVKKQNNKNNNKTIIMFVCDRLVVLYKLFFFHIYHVLEKSQNVRRI